MTAPPLQIRRARIDDGTALAALWQTLDGEHAALKPDYFRAPGRTPAALVPMLRDPGQRLFVAQWDGRVVGLIRARLSHTPSDPTLVPAKRAYLDELIVAPSHRRRGIARALIAALTEHCHHEGVSQILLTVWEGNAAAEALYRSLAYHPVGRLYAHSLHRAI